MLHYLRWQALTSETCSGLTTSQQTVPLFINNIRKIHRIFSCLTDFCKLTQLLTNHSSTNNVMRCLIPIFGFIFHILDAINFFASLSDEQTKLLQLFINVSYFLRLFSKIAKRLYCMLVNFMAGRNGLAVLIEYGKVSGSQGVVRDISKIAKALCLINFFVCNGKGLFYQSSLFNWIALTSDLVELKETLFDTINGRNVRKSNWVIKKEWHSK